MRDDRGAASVPLQQTTPLVHQHRWHDQRERLAEADVREQSAPVTPEDAREPLGGGDLVRGEPCRPWRLAFERERREVEQRARPERRDRRRRVDRPWSARARHCVGLAGGRGSARTTPALKRRKPPRAGSAESRARAVSQRELKSAASAYASSAARVAMP